MIRRLINWITRKLTRKELLIIIVDTATYLGWPLNARTWHLIVGYAAWQHGLPADAIDNPLCQRAYHNASKLAGGF